MGIVRLLLALSVLAGHANSILGLRFVFGVIAVQSFYIISGFYMSLILNEKYTGHNNSYKLFITNRLLRLYPIYWIVVTLTIFFNFLTFSLVGTRGISEQYFAFFLNREDINILSMLFLVFTNIAILSQDIVSFLGFNTTDGSIYITSDYLTVPYPLYKFLYVPQAWTVSIELMFYLIAPFLVKRSVFILSLLITISLGLRLILYGQGLNHDPWTYRFFPTELAFFLAGCLSYKFYRRIKDHNFNRIYLMISFVLLVSYTMSFQFIAASYLIKQWIYYAILALSLPFIFILTKNNRIDRFTAELSYPVYISHMLVIFVLHSLNFNNNGYYFGLMVGVVTILVSVLLVEWVVKPVDNRRQKRLLHQKNI